MAKTITIFKSDSCGGCKVLVPQIKKLAKARKLRVKVIDVDKCKTKECNAVGYIPLIKVDGKEIKTAEDLKKVFELE